MLNMFRNFTKSRVGIIVVFLVLGLIAIAFAAGDVTGLRSMVGGAKGNVIAKVGSHEITDTEVSEQIERFLRARRSENQNVTMAQFLAGHGLEEMIDQMVDTAAVQEFAQSSGMTVDSTLIQTDIANNPDFRGFDGKFNQAKFDDLLAQNRISPATYNESIARDRYISWLIVDPLPIAQMPVGLLAPYASLQLERRTGTVAMIRWNDIEAGADPDAKTLADYYQRNRAHYMIAPRRVLRYAIVHPDQFKAQAAATEAEIAEAYNRSGPRFAATEKRTVQQLVVLDQAAANAAAAEAKGGKLLADVAKGRGLEVRSFQAVDKAALAKDTSAPVADAAFSAAQGATVGPVRGTIGWVILHVDTVQAIAAKPLAQAHSELADEIGQRKTAKAIADLRQSLDEAAGNGAPFDQLVTQGKLAPQRTAALAPDGTDPAVPGSKPDPTLAPVIQAGFTADGTDPEPIVVPIAQDGSFAVVSVEKSLPAQAKPLASIQKEVNRDYIQDVMLGKARKAATDVIAQINKGMPLTQALAATGIRTLLPSKPFDLKRSALNRQSAPQEIQAFQVAAKHAKLVEAPGRAGYYIVYVDGIESHDATGDAPLMSEAQRFFVPQMRREGAEQFIEAVKRNVKVTRNTAVIESLRADLSRQGAR